MEYLIGGLIVWGMVSLPVGLLLGRMFNRMEHGQPTRQHNGCTQPQPFPMFTYVGPMPVMPMEQYDNYDNYDDYDDDEDDPSKERMN